MAASILTPTMFSRLRTIYRKRRAPVKQSYQTETSRGSVPASSCVPRRRHSCSQREKIAGGDAVSDWLTRNDGVMHNDFHIFPEICEAQASCELSRSRDLGFVSSNLVPGASTFGTRSINDFANTTRKSGNSRRSIQNSSSFNTSHDLDISNNNPSSSISSEIVFAPDTGRSRAQSNMNEVNRTLHAFNHEELPRNRC